MVAVLSIYIILDRATQLENVSFMFVSLVIVCVQLYLSFSAHLRECIELAYRLRLDSMKFNC